MKRIVKPLIIPICLAIVINVMYGFVIELFVLDGFKSKEEVIITVKENIDDLNKFTQEIYYNFYKKKDFFITIENKFIKKWNNSNEYKTKLSNRIFKICKLNYIAIDYNENKIKFSVKCRFGTYCGFYYSFNNNKNYEKINESIKKDRYTSYFELGKETALIWQMKSGWYTEKIYNNWYYYEDDWDYLNFIKYIYDDIVNISTFSEYHQKHKNSFEKYNPHKIDKSDNDE